jgi:hypothetical protein
LISRTHFRRYGGCRVPFSCFTLPNSFSAVPRASGPVFMFCAPDTFPAVPSASGPVFIFCAPGLVFVGPEGDGSYLHVLRAKTHFWWYRGRRVPFSCFAFPDTCSALRRAWGLDFIFCAPRLVFGGNEGVRSHFHVLRSRTRFRRYGGRWVLFSCFACPNSFLTVPRVLFSCFTLPKSFHLVLRASGPVFMFCAL